MERILGSVLGHAVGNAMGYQAKDEEREVLLKKPILKFKNSSFGVRDAGCWKEATANTLATMDSYINNKRFSAYDIMDRIAMNAEEGNYLAGDYMYDPSDTIEKVVKNYNDKKKPTDCGIKEDDTTAISRTLPFAIFSYVKGLDQQSIYKMLDKTTSLTNNNDVSKLGCYIYTNLLIKLFNGASIEDAYNDLKNDDYSMVNKDALGKYKRILTENIADLYATDIKSEDNTVDALEAALFVTLNSDTFREVVVGATNLGGAADSIAAISCSISGASGNGLNKISDDFYDGLVERDYIEDLTEEYVEAVKAKKVARTK